MTAKSDIKLPRSLRRYVRERKAEIRLEHGLKSEKEQELLKWANKLLEEKLKRARDGQPV